MALTLEQIRSDVADSLGEDSRGHPPRRESRGLRSGLGPHHGARRALAPRPRRRGRPSWTSPSSPPSRHGPRCWGSPRDGPAHRRRPAFRHPGHRTAADGRAVGDVVRPGPRPAQPRAEHRGVPGDRRPDRPRTSSREALRVVTTEADALRVRVEDTPDGPRQHSWTRSNSPLTVQDLRAEARRRDDGRAVDARRPRHPLRPGGRPALPARPVPRRRGAVAVVPAHPPCRHGRLRLLPPRPPDRRGLRGARPGRGARPARLRPPRRPRREDADYRVLGGLRRRPRPLVGGLRRPPRDPAAGRARRTAFAHLPPPHRLPARRPRRRYAISPPGSGRPGPMC